MNLPTGLRRAQTSKNNAQEDLREFERIKAEGKGKQETPLGLVDSRV